MKTTHIYILVAWLTGKETHPYIQSFLNKQKAINKAKEFLNNKYYEVVIRKDSFSKGEEIPFYDNEPFVIIK